MNAPSLLIIGGSGFVSGTLAQRALEAGFDVWAVTRGRRPLPAGVHAITADRQDRDAFAAALRNANQVWDLVVDCICYAAADAQQDIDVLAERARHLVLVSTDFVYAPAQRQFPQAEEGVYQTEGYGGQKRQSERVLMGQDCGDMAWTVIRPCHIYGPGSQLGCLPAHGRDTQLIARLRGGAALDLVGGGYFLQHPILARDLADLLLSVHDSHGTHGEIYLAAGPELVESRTFYQIIADYLGVPLHVNELPVNDYLARHPESAPFLCHRLYDLGKLRASGLHVPATSLVDGLHGHIESLLNLDEKSHGQV